MCPGVGGRRDGHSKAGELSCATHGSRKWLREDDDGGPHWTGGGSAQHKTTSARIFLTLQKILQ